MVFLPQVLYFPRTIQAYKPVHASPGKHNDIKHTDRIDCALFTWSMTFILRFIDCFRYSDYDLFWYNHRLFIVFYLLVLVHAFRYVTVPVSKSLSSQVKSLIQRNQTRGMHILNTYVNNTKKFDNLMNSLKRKTLK